MDGSRFAVKVLSQYEFHWMIQKSGKMARLQREGEKRICIFATLLQDIFYTLFQEFFSLYPIKDLLPGGRFNRLVIQQMLKAAEFRKARGYSKGNMPGSGMFTLYFAEKILQNLDERIVETVNEIGVLEEELFFAQTNQKAARKVAAVAENGGLYLVAENFNLEAEQWQSEVEAKKRQLISLSSRLNLLWNTSGKGKVGYSGESSHGGEQAFFETGACGSRTGTGMWAKGDLGQRLKLAGQYLGSSKLEGIARRMVQLKNLTRVDGKPTEKDILEIRGINYGVDISYAVPEELMDFFQPDRRLHFFRRLSEESISVYNITHGKKKTNTGLVLCLDNSGSMQGAKEITGKALAIALMEIASRQKRDITVIMFGGPEDVMRIFEFPKGRYTLDQLTEIGEYFLCSPGTNFEKPLLEAVRIFGKQSNRCGDIIFITDGVCKVSKEFLETFRAYKNERNIKTTSVIVGYGNTSMSCLEEFSDTLLHSRELSAVDVAGDLFELLGGE